MSKLAVGCPVLLKCHCFKGFRQTQAPINSLPTEIVCEILTTAIEMPGFDRGYAHRDRKSELATVCRRWRDIILNTPFFWTYIDGCHGFDLAHVRADRYKAFVDILIATVHRWCSLTITNNFHGCRLITDRLGCTVFPLLTHLFIPGYWPDPPILSLCPEYVPALKHLEISIEAFTRNHFPFPLTLEELAIHEFRGWTSCSLQFLSFQRLKVLSFRGYMKAEGEIQPDSIHLPLLTRLSFCVSYAEQLLRILSAPSLTHIDYEQQKDETLFTAFNGIPSKWANVRELWLTLPLPVYSTREDYHVGLPAFCLAAPEVRSMAVMAENLNELLDCRQGVYPMDHWVHLEKLTVIGNVLQFNKTLLGRYILPWLKQRRDMGKSALRLSFLLIGDKAEFKNMVEDVGQYCDGIDLRAERVCGYKSTGMLREIPKQ